MSSTVEPNTTDAGVADMWIDAKSIVSVYGKQEAYERSSLFIQHAFSRCRDRHFSSGGAHLAVPDTLVTDYSQLIREKANCLASPAPFSLSVSDRNILIFLNAILTHRMYVVQNSTYSVSGMLFESSYKTLMNLTLMAADRGVFQSTPNFLISESESMLSGTETLQDLLTLVWSLSLFPVTKMESIVSISIALEILVSVAQSRTDSTESHESVQRLERIIAAADKHIASHSTQGYLSGTRMERFFDGCCVGIILIESILDAVAHSTTQAIYRKFANFCHRKTPQALFHHRSIRIGDRFLVDWFSDEFFQVSTFLDALRESPYVNASDIENSKLFKAMEYGGPMYGVFSKEEIAIFMKVLGTAVIPSLESTNVKPLHESRAYRRADTVVDRIYHERPLLEPREVFHICCNIETHHSFLPDIERYFLAALQKAQRLNSIHVLLSEPSLSALSDELDRYPENEQEFLTALEHVNQIDHDFFRGVRFECSFDELKEKMLAGAPAALVDGAKLQYALNPDNLYDDSVRDLYKIMAEEFGDGDILRNHAAMYRRLLEELDIHVPHICDRGFVHFEGLQEASFVLPSVNLALSMFARRYLPELMGLTVSSEMFSGNVSVPMIAALDLHGVDSTFYRVHASIDNLAAGHARVAIDLTTSYVWRASQSLDHQETQRLWERVWNGFRLKRYLYADLVANDRELKLVETVD